MSISEIFQQLVELFFPMRCLGCAEIGAYFCEECQRTLGYRQSLLCPHCMEASLKGETHPDCQKQTFLDGLYFTFSYSGLVKKAIKKIKYQKVWSITTKLVELASKDFPRSQFQNFVIIPIPLHSKRFQERGFNQSELLAKAWGDSLQLPMHANVLLRTKETKPQVDLKKKERRRNIAGAFSVIDNSILSGKDVLLIDDVATSGATLDEAAKILKIAGVKRAWGLVIAHGK